MLTTLITLLGMGNGKEGDCARFFDHTSVQIEYLMSALTVASGAEAKEYSRECMAFVIVG